MRQINSVFLAITLVLTLIISHGNAQMKVQVVAAKTIWESPRLNLGHDLIRFNDRWFVVCRDALDLRVFSSADGNQWESVALIKSRTPKWGLHKPAFNVTPDGQLMLTAYGLFPADANDVKPVPAEDYLWANWYSKDGRSWSEPNQIGAKYTTFSRLVWHRGVAFDFAHGNSCGNAQTLLFYSSSDGKKFQSLLYNETQNGFFPIDMAVLFDGDRAHCLMSRYKAYNVNNPTPRNGPTWQTGLFGTAKAPYTDWEWKPTNMQFVHTNMLRMPDRRIIAVARLLEPTDRTSLCEFDPASGKLTEVLELPFKESQGFQVGLAYHDGQAWISYHATHGKASVDLVKVKVAYLLK